MSGSRAFRNLLRGPRRRDEEDGAVLAMTAFLTVVIITIAAFAVDLGLQRSAIRDMQSIADAAAMDAARILPSCDNAKLTTEANQSKQRHGSVIGDDVTLYHGVTLGGTTWNPGKRHPTLGSGVVVGAGAKILGPITVGDNARVAANSVVIDNVRPGMTVVGIPGRMVLPKEGRRFAHGIDLDHHQIPDPVGKAIGCLLDRIAQMEREIATLKGESGSAEGACHSCDDTCSQPTFDGSWKLAATTPPGA